MQICDREACSGCAACSNICPVGCIDMLEDEFGFTRPAIDEARCIACGRCRTVCPVISAVELREPRACYAAYRIDDAARADSASGGVAAVFYEQALRHQAEDAAYGVILDGRMRAVFSAARQPSEAEGFKGSKYVQADLELVYQSVAEDLLAGRRVLFIAMPCQVAACLSFLKARRVQDDGLITVDILCHGVSPWKYLSDELEHLKKRHRWSEIRRITFRSNRPNENYHLVLRAVRANSGAGEARRKMVEYNRIANADPYFTAFLKGVSLRDSCYQCRYACPKRAGDITIGDFIGLGSQKCSPPFAGKSGNASLVLVNTPKGDDFLKLCTDRMRLFERPYQEACEGGSSLQRPFPRHPSRDAFLAEYSRSSFVPAMETLFGKEMRKARVRAIPKDMAHRVARMVGVDPRKLKEFIKKREQI